MRRARRKSVLLILAGLFLLFAFYLLSSENPWNLDKEILTKIEAGEWVKLKFQVALGLYLAAAVNLVLVTGLLVAWWFFDAKLPEPDRGISTDEVHGEMEKWQSSGLATRSFFMLLAVIVLIGGGLRWQLASGSLWWDELWSVKQAVVGAYVPDKDEPGQYKFKQVSWERSAWYYRKPTNHAVASLSAKLVDSVWRNFTDVPRQEFRDIMIRLPMFVCSMVVIFMLGVLGRKWRMPWAGLTAALMLALHPWHIRYGVDARAYTFVVLWTVMACYWLSCMAGSKSRSIFPWFMFGVNQFLLLWSFLYAVWLAASFFLAAAVLVFSSWNKMADRLTGLWTLVLVNLVGAMLYLQVFLPNMIQVKVWLEETNGVFSDRHELTVKLFKNFVCQAYFGMPLNLSGGDDGAGLPSFLGQMQAQPFWMWAAVLFLGSASLSGFVYLAYARRRVLLILGSVLFGGVLALVFYTLSGNYFYHRFMIFLIIPIVFMPAFLVQWGVSLCLKPSRVMVGVAGMLLMASLYAAAVWPQIRVLNERSYAPLREVAEYFQQQRGGLFSDEQSEKQGIIAAVYGHGGEHLHVYDPEVQFLVNLAELKKVVAKAEAENLRLLVAYDHRSFNKVILPDGFEWLDDKEKFKLVASYPAIEADYFFRILEYTGQ